MQCRFIATLVLSALAAPAHAGYLVQDALISGIYNTSGNQQQFALTVQGGSGQCTAGITILFPLSAAPDADTHKRAWSLAVMAFAMNLPVSIYNYSGNACDGASYIALAQ